MHNRPVNYLAGVFVRALSVFFSLCIYRPQSRILLFVVSNFNTFGKIRAVYVSITNSSSRQLHFVCSVKWKKECLESEFVVTV